MISDLCLACMRVRLDDRDMMIRRHSRDLEWMRLPIQRTLVHPVLILK